MRGGTGKDWHPAPRRGRGPSDAYGRPPGGIKRGIARARPPRPAAAVASLRVFGLFLVLLLPLLAVPRATGIAADPVVITMLGDSITAGYGLAAGEAPPARLQAWLAANGLAARVINAGVSGDTTAGGRARLDWVLAEQPDYLIVALGANDVLRGLDPAAARANLDAILTEAQARGIPVLLVGMLAAPNLGPDYAAAFNPIYAALAASHDVPLYPFLLDGVAMRPDLNQGDGLHPNAAGAAVLAERLGPTVLEFVRGD